MPDTPEPAPPAAGADSPSQPPTGVYLGFDYGEKRIGVAVGDTVARRPRPLDTLDNQTRQRWSRIAELIEQWRPQGLVVGVPLTLDDERQAMTDAAERFCRRLKGRYHLPVYPAEERMTSLEADLQPVAGQSRDAVAAAQILADWLGRD